MASGEDPRTRVTGALTDVLVKGIGALATTAGFLTFVAIVGGAVTSVRLWRAQLPIERALEVIPKETLIPAGQLQLEVFGILGLLAVVLVYAVDPPAWARDDRRAGLCVLVTAATLTVVWLADASDGRKRTATIITLVLAVTNLLLVTARPYEPEQRATSKWKARRVWDAGLFEFRKLHFRYGNFAFDKPDEAPSALGDLREVQVRRQLGEMNPKKSVRTRTRRRVKARALWAGGITAIAFAALLRWRLHEGSFFEPEQWWVPGGVVVSTALAVVCFGVARAAGDRPWPYPLAVFFAVAMFGAFLGIARSVENPQIAPVALLQKTADGKVTGVVAMFVARTDENYWLGTAQRQCDPPEGGFKLVPKSGSIYPIKRGEVIAEQVGSPIELSKLQAQATELLRQVTARQPRGSPTPEPPTSGAVTAQRACREAKTAGVPPVGSLAVTFSPDTDRFRLDSSGSYDPAGGAIRTREWSVNGRPLREHKEVVERALSGRRADVQLIVVNDGGERSRPLTRRLTRITTVTTISADSAFDFDSATLTPAGDRTLRGLRDRLVALRTTVSHVAITGYTDYVGTEAYNDALSQRRAERVHAALLDGLRLRNARVEPPRGVGEAHAGASTFDDPQRAKDRRVEVRIEYIRRSGGAA